MWYNCIKDKKTKIQQKKRKINLNKLIVIAGPTASGKSACAVELAKLMNTKIVSADSMQIYKDLDIGTAKITKEEMQGICHEMIDIIPPSQSYSVNEYSLTAQKCVEDIQKCGTIPILSGGTGLYINSVIYNFNLTKADSDPVLREELTKMYEEKGGEYMLGILKEFDPITAEALHPNNHRRIIRAIEMYKTSGITMSEQKEITKSTKNKYDVLFFVLNTDREILYERINNRVDKMIESGLLEEIEKIQKQYDFSSSTALQAIGYKELIAYKEGKMTFSEAVEKIKLESRRYAKRQLTWFRRNEEALWIDTRDFSDNPKEIAKFMRKEVEKKWQI